ncbi:MAG: hypothetical protein U1E39_16705 [Planctomycetota bacterium]
MRRCRRTGLAVLALTIAPFALPTPRDVASAGPGGEPTAGPWVHRVVSASSADGLTWTRDEGVRWAHASVPCAVADGDRVLLYAVDADRGPGRRESTGLRVSTDGLAFTPAPFAVEGLPTAKALDPCVVRVGPGAFRLYYLASDAGGDPAATRGDHEIHVALSDDGVRFREAGVALRRPALVDPDVFRVGDRWLCYVFARGRTEIATSADGLGFTYDRDLDLEGYGTVAPVALDDGRLRLYAFEQGKAAGNAIVSFVSSDGLAWTREAGVRLQAGDDEQLTDPWVVRWKGGWRMYLKTEPRRADRRGPQGPRDGGPPRGDARPGAPRGDAPPFDGAGRPNRDRPGPWDSDVRVARVARDGAVTPLATFPRAGVVSLARLPDGRILAAHQHFPEDDDAAFDRVAVRTSADDGATFSAPTVIRVEGLPEGMRFPFDPTLVPLPDGRVRLYFTSVPLRPRPGAATPPAIHSAVSKDGVAYVVEPGVRFAVEGRAVVDCAVVLHRGVFHLYAPDGGTGTPRPGAPMPPEADRPRPGVGYHATSADGLAFTRQADVHVEGRGRWLGNAQSDGTTITFLGTDERGLWAATSADGATWSAPTTWTGVGVADPGLVRRRDGAWLVAGTGPPRRDGGEARPEGREGPTRPPEPGRPGAPDAPDEPEPPARPPR